MKKRRLIAVGACAIDTILQVPHFPQQDSKLRATGLTKRRGGNSPNSLEVLQQLLHAEHARRIRISGPAENIAVPELALIATLPSRTSHQIPFILSSFRLRTGGSEAGSSAVCASTAVSQLQKPDIDFSHCIYREAHAEPISSYIISDQSTGSRTIVNHNDLEEMTLDEFIARADEILRSISPGMDAQQENEVEVEQIWFHFEGRIPPTTLECIRYLRRHAAVAGIGTVPATVILKLSVELEKPYREGLQDLAYEADLIFYSRSWAEGEGYTSATDCLRKQAAVLSFTSYDLAHSKRTLVCTWGDQGACALSLPCSADRLEGSMVSSPAFGSDGSRVIDTVGAGDTFIAGMLFGFLCRDDGVSDADAPWSLRQKLDFANGLAGRKVVQQGFGGLGEQMERILAEWR